MVSRTSSSFSNNLLSKECLGATCGAVGFVETSLGAVSLIGETGEGISMCKSFSVVCLNAFASGWGSPSGNLSATAFSQPVIFR
ncbi:Uncharacterised protein [Legionella pneumophila]|nr:Uncharacterised protein [Legionella pneumophila]CZH19913.1 Uncharacterised protein [Legionella pneumophila]CZH49048.1 Uncharacterised protein [Legionella pneumophila]CZH56665.1 Uncharacterised protein [Legionella pneumophila]CZH57766.1 Uncharacterised protein [Legionella pneumophila]